MIEILKHMRGEEQYQFLEGILEEVITDDSRRSELVQKIMNDIPHE